MSSSSSYYNDDYRPSSRNYDSYYGYVKLVGYGTIIDINGNRIRDMRDNTYYRIEGDAVYSDYGGLTYIISGNSIKSIGGHYLYDVSCGNINKTPLVGFMLL